MNSLADICNNCRKKTEQSLDNLLRINQELQAENDKLKTEPALSPEVQYLIDLCGQMAEAWGSRFDMLPSGIREIIKAYQQCEKERRNSE